MVPMQILIFLFTLYFFVIGFCGMWRKKEVKIKTPRKTFALVVAAHNEHAVIGQLVENLKQLNYPKDMYDIYVIADNCTDNTAEIAEKAGALVHVRTHPTKKSKGYALQWMFDRLFKMDNQYDAVCVFDADNLVHPQFLMEMNNRLCKGDKVIHYVKRRRKSSSQRTRGHRQQLTLLRVTELVEKGADKTGVKAAVGARTKVEAAPAKPAKAKAAAPAEAASD